MVQFNKSGDMKRKTEAQCSRLQRILAFHNDLIDKKHLSQEATFWHISGWSSESSQRIRFQRLLNATAYCGGRVLDWGCGTGDFYAYLKTVTYPCQYSGIDINPRMIQIARQRYGLMFERVDLSHCPSDSYDYVFASGIFQFQDPVEPDYYMDIIRNMYKFARRAVAVNFLSAFRDARGRVASELYVDPAVLCNKISTICPHWIIDHSYHPGLGDFTVALMSPDPLTKWNRPDFTRP